MFSVGFIERKRSLWARSTRVWWTHMEVEVSQLTLLKPRMNTTCSQRNSSTICGLTGAQELSSTTSQYIMPMLIFFVRSGKASLTLFVFFGRIKYHWSNFWIFKTGFRVACNWRCHSILYGQASQAASVCQPNWLLDFSVWGSVSSFYCLLRDRGILRGSLRDIMYLSY